MHSPIGLWTSAIVDRNGVTRAKIVATLSSKQQLPINLAAWLCKSANWERDTLPQSVGTVHLEYFLSYRLELQRQTVRQRTSDHGRNEL